MSSTPGAFPTLKDIQILYSSEKVIGLKNIENFERKQLLSGFYLQDLVQYL